MPNEERQRATQQKINERREIFKFVEDDINQMRREGIIGKAKIEEDDVALRDHISAGFEEDRSIILQDIELVNPRFSAWKRSNETVERRIDNMRKEVAGIRERRKDLLDLYNTVFYQTLPPQSPELFLSIVVPNTDITALNSSGIGIREAFSECPLPANSMTQADSAQVHDSALFFMCKKAVSLIELAYDKTGNQNLRELLVQKATLLQDCLRASRKGVEDKTKLVNLASRIVTDMDQLGETESKQTIKFEFQAKLQKQKNALTELGPLLGGTPTLQPGKLNSLLLRETEAEESWRWRASDHELASWEAQKGTNRTRPWSVSQGQGYKIETVNFTYEFLKNRIPAVTGIPILFSSPPRSNQFIPLTYPEEGGFAFVSRIKLPEEFKISDAASSAKTFLEKIWPVTDVAVKEIKPYSSGYGSARENEHRTCIRLAREARIWNKMRHENIVPLIGFWANFAVTSDCLSFVSPWMDQGNLRDYMEQNSELDEFQRVKFLGHIANALSYMHNQTCPITHGDLRADNVLLKNDTAYLCDFGISNILDQSRGLTTAPHGNIRWQATEQLIDDPETGAPLKANIRTDMYSFGSVFLEVLTGTPPWSDLDMSDTELERYRRENPSSIQTRPSEVRNNDYWAFMLKCWRKEPTLRPTANMASFSMTTFLNKLAQ